MSAFWNWFVQASCWQVLGNALTLQNGAVWTNEDYNTQKSALIAAKFTGSQLLSLKGGDDAAHAGVIFQKDSKDIAIDNYSGNTRVFYAHVLPD